MSSGARHVEARMTEVPSDVCGVNAPSAAASFFARAAQHLNLSSSGRKRRRVVFRTNFREVLKSHPPPVPPALLRSASQRREAAPGKVKVLVRLCGEGGSHVTVEGRQVTLVDAAGQMPPKMFAFDSVFAPPNDNQADVCAAALSDVIASVVGGSDGCLFSYGHDGLGKTRTMVGDGAEPGAVPCAIWWLFRALSEHKQRSGARCSVRVSALQLLNDDATDLLKDLAQGSECGPGAYLDDLQQPWAQSELRAPSAERAAFLLDAALAARGQHGEEESRHAHFLFTLHVYQYRVEKGGRGGVSGGRSRLHLLDLGGGDKPLSTIGNVVLALCGGQKHVPYKDSRVTSLLRCAMGGVTCRVTMVAHVPSSPSRHPEALATLQLAARLHKLHRRKKTLRGLEGGGPVGDAQGVIRPFVRLQAVGDEGGAASTDYTSSSEQSCDTVIFVGATLRKSAFEPKRKKLPSADSPKMSPKMSKYMDDRPPRTNKHEGASSSSKPRDGAKGSPKPSRHSEEGAKGSRHVTDSADLNKGSPKTNRHVVDSTEGTLKGSPKTNRHGIDSADGTIKGSPKPNRHATDSAEAKGSPKPNRHDPAAEGTLKGSPKLSKVVPKSDETWIDGPRFARARLDSRALQKERWVDGPALFLDGRKERRVRRWVQDLPPAPQQVWVPPAKKEGACQTEDPPPPPESPETSGGTDEEAAMTDSSVQVTEEDIDSSYGGGTDDEGGPPLHALSADALHRLLLDLEEEGREDAHSIRSAPADDIQPLHGLRLEAFYNSIQKFPLFPAVQFCGKPTQVVPPTPQKVASSGVGSELSLLSTETKALLARAAQFSGTSSGYESLPRETPQQARGRKGTRKKQGGGGSSKRSRSVPARPPAPSPPRLPPRPRRLPPVDPASLWKSEEEVCCTSLLCCRLIDFY